MQNRIQKLINDGLETPQIASLLGITVTEVGYHFNPLRCSKAAWARMLRDEGFDNEGIASLLDMKLDSVLHFFGERPKAAISDVPFSGFLGVKWVDGQWESRITINDCKVSLGRFDDPISAAHVRNETIRDNKLDDDLCKVPERREKRR